MADHPTAPAPDILFSDDAAEARWRARFTGPRLSLPEYARDAAGRSLLVSNSSGVCEVYAWDRDDGGPRRVTEQRNGTADFRLSADGTHVWWFADDDGDEVGTWMVQPFSGSGADARPAFADVPAGYAGGVEVGERVVAVGVNGEEGFTIWLAEGDGPARCVYESEEEGWVAALSRDERLLAYEHAEHGDPEYPALRVCSVTDGSTVAQLWDGPRCVLEALSFAPVAGDSRLLVRRQSDGGETLVVWDTATGDEVELRLDLPGDLLAEWYPDGTALLVVHRHRARATLHRYCLRTGELSLLDTPPGAIDGAFPRPDGSVEYLWSSAVHPPVLRALRADGDRVLLGGPGGGAPPAGPALVDVSVPGPGGDVPALVAAPTTARGGPHPTVFLLHGGPHTCDEDRFSAYRSVWTDAGYAVVHVNYRGSTGYGRRWREGIDGVPGLTELADVAAVHDWAVATALADPARCVVAGASWGGYLSLLALGVQPRRWAAGVAEAPIADYLASYEDKMESMRAFDEALFGGSPAEVPERYRRSSPITYVDRVRAPVLVLAGANDPRCPLPQVTNYLDRLAERGSHYETYFFDAGHTSMVVAEIVRQAAVQVGFVRRVLAPGRG